MMISADWPGDVLTFWFKETQPEHWFKKDKDFDAAIRKRFLALHEVLAAKPSEALFADARTALAAVIVFDQMSRNMFRDTPRAFATDPLAFWIAQAAIAKGFDTGLTQGGAVVSLSAVRACRGRSGARALRRADGDVAAIPS